MAATSLRPKISFLEFVVQAIIVCVAIETMSRVAMWWVLDKSYPGDFIVLYNAADGDFRPLPMGNVYLFKEWLAVVFTPLLFFGRFSACMVFAGIQTICYMTLAHKMFEVRYGWILPLAVLPQFASLLAVGNIQITLCLAAIYPIPALLAIVVKPHHFVFSTLLAVVSRSRAFHARGQHLHTAGERNFHSPVGVHHLQ
jgi:hypothetical protein